MNERILAEIEANPTSSTRRVGRILGCSHQKVHKTLKSERLHPYHFTPVQNLHPGDPQPRLEFCQLMLQRQRENDNYFSRICWTDEAIFTRDGVFNFHNCHHYSLENPHVSRVQNSQVRFQVMIWAGVMDRTVIGPHEFLQSVNGERYTQFLDEDLENLLRVVPEENRQDMIFMQDGAPGHYARAARNWLDRNFPGNWIGRGGPTGWPPRSPDLTVMDFFVWGFLKNFVYEVRIDTIEQLRNRIALGFQELRDRIQDFDLVAGTTRRFELCIQQNGGHVENFL